MPREIQPILNELVRRANEATRRLRALEERDSIIEARIGSAQDSILRTAAETKKKFDELTEKLKDFETRLIRADREIAKLSKAMEKTVKRTELKELESIIELYSPLRRASFIKKEK
jgi:ABC-type transporter Mla subunit MlaD